MTSKHPISQPITQPANNQPPINRLSGAQHFMKGLTLLTHPQLRSYVIGPILINILVFVGITWFAIHQFDQLLPWLMAKIPSWLDFLVWLFWILFGGLLLLIYAYGFTLIGNLLASPFYGLLSERAEQLLSSPQSLDPQSQSESQTETATPQQQLSLKALASVTASAIGRELIKLGYFLPRIALVLLLTLGLSWIPGVNLVAPIIAMAWGSWWLALQSVDYPADNHGISFTQLRQHTRQHRLSALTFGGLTLLGSGIPLLNLLVMPAAVIGGTSFWLDKLQNQPPKDNQ